MREQGEFSNAPDTPRQRDCQALESWRRPCGAGPRRLPVMRATAVVIPSCAGHTNVRIARVKGGVREPRAPDGRW